MNNERNVGAFFYARKLRRQDQEKGITLIALVITIIVMLVLVAVTISMAVNGGLFGYAGRAGAETNEAIDVEQTLASGAVEVDGVWYDSIDDYINNKPGFNAKYWDKKAAPEDVFIWQSDDPNDEGYGVVVGYTENVQNYSTLRFPSRCTKITLDETYVTNSQIRSYTSNIKEIEIPNTVVELGYSAFGGGVAYKGYIFGEVKKITIPNTVTSIGEKAFEHCFNLTNIIIPKSVTSIGYEAFKNCRSLTSIVIPDSVTNIGGGAFASCEGLTNVIIPDSVTNIGDSAFASCEGLTNVIIPDTVTSVGDWTFLRCSKLTSVTIPDSVTNIGKGAFSDCINLTNLTIPNTVASIGSNAFSNVPHIEYHGSATGAPWGAKSMN